MALKTVKKLTLKKPAATVTEKPSVTVARDARDGGARLNKLLGNVAFTGRCGVGTADALSKLGIDSALFWGLGWENRRRVAMALQDALASDAGAAFRASYGKPRTVRVRWHKADAVPEQVSVSACGTFYRRTPFTMNGGERITWPDVHGPVAFLRMLAVDKV